MDTHALSEPAYRTALEVLAANDLHVILGEGYVPTPVISHAVLEWNRLHPQNLADAIILTPSHNPPQDGGVKYNPPHGGPASSNLTSAIQERARELMRSGLKGVQRMPFKHALTRSATEVKNLMISYVEDLSTVLDMELIRGSGLTIGVDPMGGAAVHYWEPIAERYRISIDIINKEVDPAFAFMPFDHDGKVRMDCSSRHAMQRIVDLREDYDIAFGNDPDVDRHGIVTRSSGLLNPNHYLSVASKYLFEQRSDWPSATSIAKTLVSSSMIDRVADDLGRQLYEVPVGFKWFVDGLYEGRYGIAGEESAGASFLRRDGTVWTTDKDGIILALLSAEILASTGLDPGEHYQLLIERYGEPVYTRIDSPATTVQKEALAKLSPTNVTAHTLAGEPIQAKLTHAPGNHEPIGGLKITTEPGWFAARPSGTEDLYKIYAESFRGADHLSMIIDEAKSIVDSALSAEESK